MARKHTHRWVAKANAVISQPRVKQHTELCEVVEVRPRHNSLHRLLLPAVDDSFCHLRARERKNETLVNVSLKQTGRAAHVRALTLT